MVPYLYAKLNCQLPEHTGFAILQQYRETTALLCDYRFWISTQKSQRECKLRTAGSCDIQETLKTHKEKVGGLRLDFIRRVSSFQVLYQSQVVHVSDVEPTSCRRNITIYNNPNNF